jgi:hypothetical protein
MQKTTQVLGVFCLMAASVTGMVASAMAAPTERYLHVKVEDAKDGESVKVNLPLSVAEKILPTISKGNLHEGRVTIGHADLNGIDIKALLEAIRTTPDNEFVTVTQKDQDVRVAKSNGNFIVHVRSHEKGNENVDVTIPMKVVDALFSTAKDDEVDVIAALHALSDAGDALLITVQDASQHVRIWVDSRGTTE